MRTMIAQSQHTCLKNSNNFNTISPLNLMNGNEESDKLVKVQIMKLLSVHKLLTEPYEPVDILILVQTNNITSRVKKHICFLDR